MASVENTNFGGIVISKITAAEVGSAAVAIEQITQKD